LQIDFETILLKALDLITVVVPPALPATMSIGTSFAIGRLRKRDIFCISPNRVNIGGKVDIVAFDKTGTLTEDGLDILGVQAVDRTTNSFAALEDDVDNVPIVGPADAKTPLMHGLATCHALKLVDGEAIGDPLDLRMFEFTRWTLEEGLQGTSRPSETASPKPSKAKAGPSKVKSSKIPERPPTLVQSVVRPPGGERFKLEDALRAGSKVRVREATNVGYVVDASILACSFSRARDDPYL
jgi:cation-transporting ATPase 13A2